jgi:ribosomal protein S18 acetylase RimI-like enzyme
MSDVMIDDSHPVAVLYLGVVWPPREADVVFEAAMRVESLTMADVASAVELAVRVLGVKPGDRGEQFAADITGERRQTFVAKVGGRVVAYGRVLELAAGEAGPGTPAGCYLSGVLVDPAWRSRGIATALTRTRLRWAFARTGTVFYVTGADNGASLHLHAAFGFQELGRFPSERSAAGVDVLSQLIRTADGPDIGRLTGTE